ncbi:MAG: hypothetical protein LBH82_06045 [Bacteroidales bacterium]|jgi:hypothetical protein|nr:hypothetical protein [Bacteroidales bacterium]
MKKEIYCILSVCLFLAVSCREKPVIDKRIPLSVQFIHRVDGVPIVLDTKHYSNEAGNKYIVNEIKYFISELHFYKNDKTKIAVRQNKGIHYVDTDYPNTLFWTISENIPEGHYDSIGFTFGLNAADNYSYRFVNPPESNMSWPQLLGGGYHYMMINGKFLKDDSTYSPLNIHLGRGQIYRGSTQSIDSLIGFVDNHFSVVLKKSFRIRKGHATDLTFVMNMENWFKNPFIYDFNYWGSHIMQNQPAMQMLKENGRNVFSAEE